VAKIVLIVEYDGTAYHGFQLQANAPTIQGEMERALGKIAGRRIPIIAASRTDSGVHARGQVASFKTDLGLSLQTWRKALNYYLPQDIAIKDARRAEDGFDVRRHAISREYQYCILNGPARSPLRRNFVHSIPRTLDAEAMNRACRVLDGEQDFASFTPSREGASRSTIRTVYKAEVAAKEDLLIFDMIASSFLPHQVRATAGGLIEVGLGKIGVEAFREMTRAKRPGAVGPLAPAKGLFLVKVNYREERKA
jgi:tRNA pseudouridine38-40 synthase